MLTPGKNTTRAAMASRHAWERAALDARHAAERAEQRDRERVANRAAMLSVRRSAARSRLTGGCDAGDGAEMMLASESA